MYRVKAAVVALSFQALPSDADASTQKGTCEFENEPVSVGYFWDPTCEVGQKGCNADAKNPECRFCGAGNYTDIDCPASSCHFQNEPFVAYYWDKDCVVGQLGCWADGVHEQCRFCGDSVTNITCPEGAAQANSAGCAFDNEPDVPYYWEPGCDGGLAGCNADGKNVRCRFCGAGDYTEISCPASQVCNFTNEPTVPYFWDPSCTDGGLGCKADGISQECRFCAARPFETVSCPGQAQAEDNCTWPALGEPSVPSFWDPTCQEGELGCWADGLHAGCRFCGEGNFASIPCSRRLSATDKQAAPTMFT